MTKQATVAAETVTETEEVVVPTINLDDYAELKTKSAKIRAMRDDGHSRSLIAKTLGIRYQHVRNVEMTPLKKAAKTEA